MLYMYVIIDSHGLIASKLSYMTYADWVPTWAYIANRNISGCTLLLFNDMQICSLLLLYYSYSFPLYYSSSFFYPLYSTTLFLSTLLLLLLSNLLLFSSLLYYSCSLLYYSFPLYSTTLFLSTVLLLLFCTLLFFSLWLLTVSIYMFVK
jgi:hypothetical protein